MRLLIVEDDRMLGDLMARAMGAAGYRADWVTTAEEALIAADAQTYDAILLDLGLPMVDGMHVVRKVRQQKNDTPILVITAQDALDRKLEGLDLGADDYIVKPFDLDELLA